MTDREKFELWASNEPGMNEKDDTARLVKLEAWRAWETATIAEREECAVLAASTVCDIHLPTGVKIYGRAAANAIRMRYNE